ncbi:MAG: hypothetical protein IPH07_10320 [Deltaproteobacteria bacterium]|nr:hypothetical protein [Deltaproteobacteria bacterium]MBP7286541.1 hypothetical protein [Nannocystaceae bacterium]
MVVKTRWWMIAAVLCGACGEPAGDDDGSSSATNPSTASASSTDSNPETSSSGDPTTGEVPTTGEEPTGGASACAEATSREACAATFGFDGFACQWLDMYSFEVVDAACAFTPVEGGGACVDNPLGDTDCGSEDACGSNGTVYFRMADDGTTEVLRSGSTCTHADPAGAWMTCAPGDGGVDTDATTGGSDSSGGGGASSTGGASEPDLCTCACDELMP